MAKSINILKNVLVFNQIVWSIDVRTT